MPGREPSVEIRRADTPDADAIADVHARSWPATYAGLLPGQLIADVVAGRERRAQSIRELLADETIRTRIWVAAEGDHVVGMAIWGPTRDDDATEATAEVEAIYLDPAFLRRGIGRRLMQAVMADVEQSGFNEATLWVLDGNGPARSFYTAVGWQADGATKVEERPTGRLNELRYRWRQHS